MAVHYYPYINKIITQLQLREKVFAKYLKSSTNFDKPFITVAREPGSGGRPIAEKLAEKLGFTFVDEQIIDKIAKSTKKRRDVIQAVDEKARTAIEDMVHSILNKEYMDDTRYISELVQVILSYAYQGNVVILGRGANFITPFSKGLHVYATAPYKVRVERAIEFEGHSQRKAKKVIKDVEKERAEFVKKYFSRDLDKKNSYDLVLNTSYFTVEQSRDLILEAFYKKFPLVTRYSALVMPS